MNRCASFREALGTSCCSPRPGRSCRLYVNPTVFVRGFSSQLSHRTASESKVHNKPTHLFEKMPHARRRDSVSESLTLGTPSFARLTRFVKLSAQELSVSSSSFLSHEHVLDNVLAHFTSPENHQEISRENVLRGSHVPGYYDGILADASSPPRNYFRLTLATSDGIHFPFSSYPQSVEPGGKTMRVLVEAAQFTLDDNYRLYYVGATPSQRGPNFSVRVHSHVVFVPREYWAWADEKLVRLDKSANPIAHFSPSGVSVATKFDSSLVSHIGKTRRPSHSNDEPHLPSYASDIESSGSSPYPEHLAHEVTVVVLGDVELRSDSSSWSAGSRLKFSQTSSGKSFRRRPPDVHCPECSRVFGSISNLKGHYRGVHADARPFECTAADCSRSFARHHELLRHQRNHGGEFEPLDRGGVSETLITSTSEDVPHASEVLSPQSSSEVSVALSRVVDLSASDLTSPDGPLSRSEPLLNNEIHFYTSPSDRQDSRASGRLRPSNLSGVYVGPLASTSEETPRGIMLHALPASEGIVPPFWEAGDSQTLEAVPPGGEVSQLSVNLHRFYPRLSARDGSSEQLRLYFLTSIPTQFGPQYATRVHSHVVLCLPEHFDWCDAHLHRLSPNENRLLQFKDDGVEIATQIDGSVILDSRLNPLAVSLSCTGVVSIRCGLPANDTRRLRVKGPRPHSVSVIVLGELQLEEQSREGQKESQQTNARTAIATSSFRWSSAARLKFQPAKMGRGRPLAECPSCQRTFRSVSTLKSHFRSAHTDFLFRCSWQRCFFSTKDPRALQQHLAAEH